MKHIHIALVLLVCSFITLSFAKNTLVYRRYHRKRPSSRKEQKNVVEIVEVFKTHRRPPAIMKSDKSIENFLLCDAKCEKKRFLTRRKMCLRTGRFCPTRPSGSKSRSTTQINVSTPPIYKKPTVYEQNPYGNRNPDYTHLYPWSRPSVTVTKYQPDRSKDFNMTIVEVNNDTVVTTAKYDYEYYDGDNDDRHPQYLQRRSTTFKVPTSTWLIPEMSTVKTTETESVSIAVDNVISDTSAPATTITIPTSTFTITEPPEVQTILTERTAKPILTTLATTTEIIPSSTEYLPSNEPVNVTKSTTVISFQAPPTEVTIFDSTTASTATIELPTTEIIQTTTAISKEEQSEASTSTTTEITATPTTTELPPITTKTTELSTSTTNSTENQTEATEQNPEEEGDNGEEYGEEYVEGEEEEGAEEGIEEVGEEENGEVDGENGNEAYDYDDDGNYDDEDQAEDQT